MKKNVRLKDTNRAAQERQIQSKEAELQRKNKEIQSLKQKIKESNHKQISKSTNGFLHSNDNKRSNKMPRTRQNFLKVSQPSDLIIIIYLRIKIILRSDKYFQNWTILQQKLKSSIAAKEALKDVETELKRLMAERKRIEEQDKVRSKKNSLNQINIKFCGQNDFDNA